MKKSILLLILLFSLNWGYAQSISKNFNQSINPTNKTSPSLLVQLRTENYEIKRVVGSSITINGTVILNNDNIALVDYLTSTGRYAFEEQHNNHMVVIAQRERKTMNMGAKELEEDIKYIISVPYRFTSINIIEVNKELIKKHEQ